MKNIEFWNVAHLSAPELDFLKKLVLTQRDDMQPGSDLRKLAAVIMVKLDNARGN